MQARARKAEERKAKKEAEAAAKAKAKASGESASTENGPQDANKAAAPDAAADTAANTAAEIGSERAGKGQEGAVPEARKGGDDMDVDGTLASLKAVEAEAGLPIAAPATANGDIEMAEVSCLYDVTSASGLKPLLCNHLAVWPGWPHSVKSCPACLRGLQRRLKRSFRDCRPNRRLTRS